MIEIQLKNQALSVADCTQKVQDDGAGAINLFVGTVRNATKGRKVLKLDFEAYKPMAINEMRKIADQAQKQWNAQKIVIHHRIGTLTIGEIAVIIAVSTPHRKASFEACQFCIDTLKQSVPIWKKEFFEDGEIWVAAHP